jgi:hypothetical protein
MLSNRFFKIECFVQIGDPVKKILFLNPPGCERSDGGAGARYQTKREVRSFRYPSWLSRPAAMVPGSHAVDASPDGLTIDHVAPLARDYEFAVLHASTPTLFSDERFAARLKEENPRLQIAMVGAHVDVLPSTALLHSVEHFDRMFYFRLRKMFSLAGGMLRDREVMGRRLRESVEFFRFLYEHKHTVRPSATVGGTGN